MSREWVPVQLVTDGQPLAEQWLAFGSRTWVGSEVKVVFGGQVMVHAKVRFLMASPGQARPASFADSSRGTLSQWRRKQSPLDIATM